MEATRSSFITKLAIGLSAVLLAAVMTVCIPQGQALAVDTAPDAATAPALQDFTATKAVGEQSTASAADVANAPKQASGVKSKYGLLCKVGKKYYLYPANKKGKKLGTYWRVGSTITTVFVKSNAKKYTGTWKIRYKSTIKLSYPVSYKITKIIFLTKKGKNSVDTIGKNAIDSTVKSVKNFNKTKVKTIGENAFGSTKITKLAFPKTLTKMGKNAFRKTSKLKTVTGLEKTKLKSVPAYAFAESGITSIYLPSTVTSIGENAFRQDKALKTVKGLGSTKVTSIGKYAFEETGITSLALPATLKSIGNEAFAMMPYLKTVSGLEKTKLTTISDYAFAESPLIESLSLPTTCTSIGYGAFMECSSLKTLTLNANCIVSGSSSMLSQSGIANISSGVAIKVPNSLMSSYRTTYPWSNYSSKIAAI